MQNTVSVFVKQGPNFQTWIHLKTSLSPEGETECLGKHDPWFQVRALTSSLAFWIFSCFSLKKDFLILMPCLSTKQKRYFIGFDIDKNVQFFYSTTNVFLNWITLNRKKYIHKNLYLLSPQSSNIYSWGSLLSSLQREKHLD